MTLQWKAPAILLTLALVLSGCLGVGPRSRPESSGGQDQTQQIQKAVKNEFQTDESIKSLITDETRKTAQGQMLDAMLKSPDNQQKMQEALKKLLSSPDGQKALSDALKSVISAPDAKKQIQDAVKAAITEMMSGAGGKAGGGGSSNGGGGGSSGG